MVNETASLLRALGREIGSLPGGYTLCVREGLYGPRAADHTLYLGLKNFRTAECAIGVAQMVCREEVPYGLAYALGIRQAQAVGYEMQAPELSLDQALPFLAENPCYWDLNCACMSSPYIDDMDLPKLQVCALALYDHLAESGELGLLLNWSPTEYRRCLNEFLTAQGLAPYDNSDLDGTVLLSGGEANRVVWKNDDGTFYVEAFYSDIYGKRNPLVGDYPTLRQYILDCCAQAAYVRRSLAALSPETAPVTVRFVTADGSSTASDPDVILVNSADLFLQSYARYMLRATDTEDWAKECICQGLANTPVDEHTTPNWYSDMVHSLALDPDVPEDAAEYALLEQVKDHLGHEIDWYSAEDNAYQLNAYLVNLRDIDFRSALQNAGGVGAKVSFFQYLESQASRETTILALAENRPMEQYKKSWISLIQDWLAYLDTFDWS